MTQTPPVYSIKQIAFGYRARTGETDETSVYKVMFKTDTQKIKITVDAFTGAILEKSAQDIAE